IQDIIIVVGYRREQIFDYMGNGERFGVDITYKIQERQLGTAHALMQVRELTGSEFLVLPGDNLIDANTIKQFVNTGPDAVLVKKMENSARYGIVSTEGNKVREIIEKTPESESDVINTGIYSFTDSVYDYMDAELGIPDAINNMIIEGRTVSARETEGTWLDVVYPWDMLSLNDAILQQLSPSQGGTIEAGVTLKGQVTIGKDTIIRSNTYLVGPIIIGENCDIGPNVCILPSTSIGDNVVIAPFTEIENSVIGADTNIGPGSIIQDSVVDQGCVIKGHFTACSGDVEIRANDSFHQVNVGAMLGVGCNLGNSVTAQPGLILGNYCQVQAMKLLSGSLPDKSSVY
ncbi:MAG: sugar phosphate nucleotidyltransferase, partial [Dehalococcoidales bacterium]